MSVSKFDIIKILQLQSKSGREKAGGFTLIKLQATRPLSIIICCLKKTPNSTVSISLVEDANIED